MQKDLSSIFHSEGEKIETFLNKNLVLRKILRNYEETPSLTLPNPKITFQFPDLPLLFFNYRKILFSSTFTPLSILPQNFLPIDPVNQTQ